MDDKEDSNPPSPQRDTTDHERELPNAPPMRVIKEDDSGDFHKR